MGSTNLAKLSDEEKDKLQVEVNTDELNEQIAGQMEANNGLQA